MENRPDHVYSVRLDTKLFTCMFEEKKQTQITKKK